MLRTMLYERERRWGFCVFIPLSLCIFAFCFAASLFDRSYLSFIMISQLLRILVIAYSVDDDEG